MKKALRPKNRLLFEELLLNKNFLQDIKQFRKRNGIFAKGFANFEEYEKWQREYQPETIKAKINVERIRLDHDDKLKTEAHKRADLIDQYHLGICTILYRYDLSFEWWPVVNDYALFARAQEKLDTHEVEVRRELYGRITLHEELVIKIGASMSVKRFVEKFQGQTIWSNAIEPLQKQMQGYKGKGKRPSKAKTSIQKKAYDLHNKKKSDEEIYEKLNMQTNLETVRQHRKRYRTKITPKG